MFDIYKFLEKNKIKYQRFDHHAVFTCEEAEKWCPVMPGVSTKNLFLRDKNGKKHFLVVINKDKSLDLKKLKEVLDVSKLSFASEERLLKYLGLTPGSVTLLGVVNDNDCAVEVIIDKEIFDKTLQCHPLINTATLVIETAGIRQFLELTKHQAKVLDLPAAGAISA